LGCEIIRVTIASMEVVDEKKGRREESRARAEPEKVVQETRELSEDA
jgi:hypothetical protein